MGATGTISKFIYFALIKPTLNALSLIHQVTLFRLTPTRFGARRCHREEVPSQLLTFQHVTVSNSCPTACCGNATFTHEVQTAL